VGLVTDPVLWLFAFNFGLGFSSEGLSFPPFEAPSDEEEMIWNELDVLGVEDPETSPERGVFDRD
jgi:hypothetical protein